MIRAAIICPNQNLAAKLQEALSGFRNVSIGRVIHQYPNEAKLPAFLSASTPELVFISTESLRDAIDVTERIDAQTPGVPIVAIHDACDPSTMLAILRAGVKDFLTPPFEPGTIQQMLQRVEALRAVSSDQTPHNAPIFAFLPAKPGVGATTIAVNAALTLARKPRTKVLLIDLDLNNGLIQFMLSLKSDYSVTDAAENASELDENIWSKVVTSVGNLDVLPAGPPKPGFRIDSSQVRQILEFAQRNYDVVCVDLSGMMEKYSLDVLQYVQQVFLVCTPEVASLHLANGKLEILRNLELEQRTSILANRAEKGHRRISVAEMETVLRQKVSLTLPNAYDALQHALVNGKPVAPASELGAGFDKLARIMVPDLEPVPDQRRGLLNMLLNQRTLQSVKA